MSKRDDLLRVMALNQRRAADLDTQLTSTLAAADASLAQTDDLVAKYAHLITTPTAPAGPSPPPEPPAEQDWSELVAEARAEVVGVVSFADLLTTDELRAVAQRQVAFVAEQCAANDLDAWDGMAASISGLIAAVVDLVMVGGPTMALGKKITGLIGAPAHHDPSSVKVSFDAILSRDFGARGNHRWNSISHHPTLGGFIRAIRDVLCGTSTHVIGGQVITVENLTKGAAVTLKTLSGEGLLLRIFSAARVVLSHWFSDVNTPLGLPAPWMLLAKFLQVGRFSVDGVEMNLSQLAHHLFKNGLDLRRFIADGITVCLNAVVVRMWFLCRTLHDGGTFSQAISAATRTTPRLRKALLCAHGITAAANAGKVALTKNPLGINLAQWTALLWHLGAHLKWVIFEAASAEDAAHIQRWVADMHDTLEDIEQLEASLSDMEPVLLG